MFSLILTVSLVIGGNFYESTDDKVPNCWNKTKDCTYQEIDTTLDTCTDWYVDQPLEGLECNRTKVGAEEVSMISDPGNHIRGSFSDAKYEEEKYYLGISGHQDLEFLPSGLKVIGDQSGLLHIVDGTSKIQVFNLEKTVDNEEIMKESSIGVKGIAVDPNYSQNNRIYIYYSLNNKSGGYQAQNNHSNWHFRVDSFTMTENRLEKQEDILDIKGAFWHSGGGVEIGPDNKLYVSVGEANEPKWSQDLDTRRGKILRINRDGSIPEDNPFEDKYIYSLGHRNPQGVAWNPENNNMWSAEHGNKRQDEINLIEKGKNYGWGRYICGETRDSSIELGTEEAVEPVRCFENWTMAPSRMMFIDDKSHPWYGDLFLAGLRGKHLRRMEIDKGEIKDEEIFYMNEEAPTKTGVSRRLRDVEYFNESIWMLGDEGRGPPASGLIKLSP